MTSKPPERLRLDRLATPIGEALIVTDEAGHLRAFDWADCESGMARLLRLHYGSVVPEPGAAPANIMRLLRDYFEGDVGCLGAIEWRTAGTPFQRSVWTALTTIAPGETLSYGALAAKLGCPKIRSRRRHGQRVQSDQRGGAVSSRDRCRWLADRLWRRHRAQTVAAQTRGEGFPRPSRRLGWDMGGQSLTAAVADARYPSAPAIRSASDS